MGERVETARATAGSHVQEATKVAHVAPMQREPYQSVLLATLLLQAGHDAKPILISKLLILVLLYIKTIEQHC